ncbi:hypothetical protein AO377_0209 [Moraxella catarrhalis]|uniref:Uncharacterized protein n=1 Tax=Moraxella catarrhalis TaxID=480 RepID=A0A198XSS5_MORCA|nr:hypothetical protein EJK52_0482 [Moraxella catarrhalis]AZQ90854.1 hypothetical protein EJK51_0481 [Moraxella catarrhalis]AZQ93603.1 hypothetical protein EJK53_0477 [Moraxella catarrhalis]AZQ95099.1 hypothetical protein EJK48_0480 [Moraxella catarrhalis]OAV11707.1 hypothetical protein AO377_0209 [Moraxella catarrhalis]
MNFSLKSLICQQFFALFWWFIVKNLILNLSQLSNICVSATL